jgi:hypothetical protein
MSGPIRSTTLARVYGTAKTCQSQVAEDLKPALRVGVGRAGSDPWWHSGNQRWRPLAKVSTRSMVSGKSPPSRRYGAG